MTAFAQYTPVGIPRYNFNERHVAAAATLTPGDFYQQADGLLGFYSGLESAASADPVVFYTTGIYDGLKYLTTDTYVDGAPVYFNTVTKVFRTSLASNCVYAGTAIGANVTGTSYVRFSLNGNIAPSLSGAATATTLTVSSTATLSGAVSVGGALTVTGPTAAFGIDGTGVDVTFYGDTVGASSVFDYSTDGWVHTNSGQQFLYGTSAAAATNSLLIGGGTSSYPCLTGTAGKNFVELRCKSTASSGDNRLMYLRYVPGGAGTGNFDCLRVATAPTAAVSVARGGDIGCEVSATGYVTGTAYGCRNQLYVQGIVPAGGEYYGSIAEMYFDASSTIAGPTAHAILCVAASGDATAVGTCKNALAFVGAAGSGGGDMISLGANQSTVTGTIRILVNNAVRYLAYYSHEGHA
jgi:hypothetical protein